MKKIYGILSLLLCIILILSIDNIQATNAMDLFEDNTAKSYIVVDDGGKVLIEKNSNEKREVASICKLMTTLLTFENLDRGVLSLEDKFIASSKACAVEGSQAFLDEGSEYFVGDLLKSVVVASANDSAIVLAEGIGGNENNFVNMMNARAKSLGMKNTKYYNSTGLSGGEQYSTAYDTAILLKEASKYDIYKEYCQIWIDSLIHPSGRKTELVNTNRLIKYYSHCMTGKTGFTDEAGYCLSSTSLKNNLHLTCVVLGCDSSADRFTESVELYNYAYANFISDKIVDKNMILEEKIKILVGAKDYVSVCPNKDYYLTRNVGDDIVYNIQYDYYEDLKAPIVKGDKVGDLIIISNGQILDTIDIVAIEDVEKQSFSDILNKIFNDFKIIK